MRQFLKVTLVAALFFSGAGLFAQTVKIGHIDSNKLLSIMPEKEEAQKQIEDQATEYDNQIKTMKTQYQTLVAEYVEQEATFSEAIKTDKQKEIKQLQTRIEEFDRFAQAELQNKQTELLKPVFDRASKAIRDVGTENGFLYVFDISAGAILFNSENSVDIMLLVKEKLGIH